MDESDYHDTEEPHYPWWRLSDELKKLLIMAGLPLLDGFFLSFLATDMWRDAWRSAAFGLTAFSGAGCVIAAMRLKGGIMLRAIQVLLVYSIVGIGAFLISLARPFFINLLPANLYLFTGIFLIGLGLWMTDMKFLRKVAVWMGFEAAVKVMIISSLIHGFINGTKFAVAPDSNLWAPILIAVGVGLGLSMGGMLFGLVLNKIADQKPMNLGAGLSLLLMGISVLGLNIPSIWVIVPLIGGCIWSICNSLKSLKQKVDKNRVSPLKSETTKFKILDDVKLAGE